MLGHAPSRARRFSSLNVVGRRRAWPAKLVDLGVHFLHHVCMVLRCGQRRLTYSNFARHMVFLIFAGPSTAHITRSPSLSFARRGMAGSGHFVLMRCVSLCSRVWRTTIKAKVWYTPAPLAITCCFRSLVYCLGIYGVLNEILFLEFSWTVVLVMCVCCRSR